MGIEQKERRGRRDYLNDYQKTVNGGYIYAGKRFEYSSKTGKTLKMWTAAMLLLSLGAIAGTVIPGFLRVPGLDYCRYVLIPYTLGLLCIIYMMCAVVRVLVKKGLLYEWEMDKGASVLSFRIKLTIIVALINVPCEILYLILNGAGGRVVEAIAFIICHLATAGFMYLALKFVKDTEWNLVTREMQA